MVWYIIASRRWRNLFSLSSCILLSFPIKLVVMFNDSRVGILSGYKAMYFRADVFMV